MFLLSLACDKTCVSVLERPKPNSGDYCCSLMSVCLSAIEKLDWIFVLGGFSALEVTYFVPDAGDYLTDSILDEVYRQFLIKSMPGLSLCPSDLIYTVVSYSSSGMLFM